MKSLGCIFVFFMSFNGIKAGLHERRLLNDLFMYYDARLVKYEQIAQATFYMLICRERPVRNESYSVQLQFGVKYAQFKRNFIPLI